MREAQTPPKQNLILKQNRKPPEALSPHDLLYIILFRRWLIYGGGTAEEEFRHPSPLNVAGM